MCHLLFRLLCLMIFIVNTAYAKQSAPVICDQKYALCTAAQCLPDPHHPDSAICHCIVYNGYNVGYSTCEQRVPIVEKNHTTKIISTFSAKQFKTKKAMICPAGNTWANCLDALCIIDSMDATKAECNCKMMHSEKFITFGGDCDTKTCQHGLWSGARMPDNILLQKAMADYPRVKEKIKETACQSTFPN